MGSPMKSDCWRDPLSTTGEVGPLRNRLAAAVLHSAGVATDEAFSQGWDRVRRRCRC